MTTPINAEALITIVDDEPLNVALLQSALKRAGYTNVETFGNGEDALARLSRQLSDVILLDINMPGMSGTDVLTALRRVYPDTFVPVVILTADSGMSIREQSLSLGAIDFLLKPVNVAELLLRVSNILRTRRLQVELERERVHLEERVAERTRDLRLANDALVLEKQATERMRDAEQALEQRLRHLAFHDILTDLGNRALLSERLEERLTASRHSIGLLLLDMDDFKSLNDAAGHAAGDTALRRVADVLRTSIGPSDLAARIGGDEFAVLVSRPDALRYLYELANKVRDMLAQPFVVDDREVSIGCSIGLSVAAPHEVSASELMRRADVAMYTAKSRKPCLPILFNTSMDDSLLNRLAMVSDFREAVANQQFRLHFQPIVRLTSGMPVGFEALIRWEHPILGHLSPNTFIPVSEDSGWIRSIGRWATEEAVRFLAGVLPVPGMQDSYVSVNASPIELKDPGFAESVGAVIERAGISPSQFVVEITERVAIDAAYDDRPLNMLATLRDLGVGVALDDFGTGYSALSYLRQLPLTALKIDKSFVHGIGRDEREEQITACIVALARAMSLTTIAEGVEEAAQALWLEAAACLNGQGYLFSRPLTTAAAYRYLESFGREAA